MSNVPLPEPHHQSAANFNAPDEPFYTADQMHAHAAAVSAAKDAEIAGLRAELAEMKSGVIRQNAVMQELEGVIAHLEKRAGSMLRIEVTLDDSDVPIPIEVCGTVQMLDRLEAYNAGRMSELTRLRTDIEQYVKIARELRERVRVLEDALDEVLAFQSAPKQPTIHDWGRWRRIRAALEKP